MDELLDDLACIYEAGNTGVVLALTKSLQKFKYKQNTFLKVS